MSVKSDFIVVGNVGGGKWSSKDESRWMIFFINPTYIPSQSAIEAAINGYEKYLS